MIVVDKIKDLVGDTEKDAIEMAQSLSKEIAAGVLEIESAGRTITVRIKEHGNFSSGSAELSGQFKPVLKIIRQQLRDIEGRIIVEGHTDPDPIATSRFRSNWALSSARAVTVAHGLFEDPEIDQERFTITGYADTKPLVSNTTAAGKARNRRVEVVVHQGLDAEVRGDLEILKTEFPNTYENVRRELIQTFELSPEEIF